MTKNPVILPGQHITTERTEKVLARFLNTAPAICPERAELITESYRETEALPMVLRRAKALEKILTTMSVFIEDDELIVGNQARQPTKLHAHARLPINNFTAS